MLIFSICHDYVYHQFFIHLLLHWTQVVLELSHPGKVWWVFVTHPESDLEVVHQQLSPISLVRALLSLRTHWLACFVRVLIAKHLVNI